MTVALTAEQRRNAETVHRLYDCERRQDLEGWIALWHPEGRQTFPWGDGSHDVFGLAALRASTAEKFATRSNVVINEVVQPMADPCWVFSVTAISIHFDTLGRTLVADLWCRFHFDADGLILEHQEVLDSCRIAAMLGQPE